MYVKEKLDISKYFVVGPENTNGRPVERMIKAVVDEASHVQQDTLKGSLRN